MCPHCTALLRCVQTAIKELLEWKAEVEEQINGMMDEMDTMR